LQTIKGKNIDIPRNQTRGTNKTQNPKYKTITKMTGQHEPL